MEILEKAKKAAKRLKFDFPYDLSEWIFEKNMFIENYHKHTSWSNLVSFDSATKTEDFLRLSDKYGCKCYFSTEHGYPGVWLNVYDICKKTQDEKFRKDLGIKNPLNFRYGVEVYWVKDCDLVKNGKKDNTNCHMVIIAKNYNAIRKLNHIVSVSHDKGFYYKPRIDLKTLFTLSSEDVFVTSACVAGWKYENAAEIWLQIHRHFKDSFFLEYQANNADIQKTINRRIYEMSKEFKIQTIIGLDTHYLTEEDKKKRKNLLLRKKISYPEEDGFYMDFPTGKELFRRMKTQGVVPDEEIIYAMLNTHVFTSACEEIHIDTDFKIPICKDFKDYSYEQRADVLKNRIDSAYEKEEKSPEREKAKNDEFKEIAESKTVDYFFR